MNFARPCNLLSSYLMWFAGIWKITTCHRCPGGYSGTSTSLICESSLSVSALDRLLAALSLLYLPVVSTVWTSTCTHANTHTEHVSSSLDCHLMAVQNFKLYAVTTACIFTFPINRLLETTKVRLTVSASSDMCDFVQSCPAANPLICLPLYQRHRKHNLHLLFFADSTLCFSFFFWVTWPHVSRLYSVTGTIIQTIQLGPKWMG